MVYPIKMWLCYCLLRADSGASYVGATVDMKHRFRQHNCEIKGGAKYTSAAVKAGHTWKILCTVSGFPNERAALQFEWKWKALTAKKSKRPADKRIDAVINLLNSERSTSTSEPFATYEPLRVEIHWNRPETVRLTTTTLAYASVFYAGDVNPPLPELGPLPSLAQDPAHTSSAHSGSQHDHPAAAAVAQAEEE